MTLAPATRLGPYEIVAPLGAGGMGEVYRAKDSRLGREVAIKVLPSEFASDPERLRRFEQEAKAVSALNHPHIVTLYEVGQSEQGPYLVLEKIEGESLRELLKDGGLPVKRVLTLGAQIAEGLAKAHAAGIVHRDLKPENVMVTEDGFAKILDFGLAKLAYPELVAGAIGDATTLAEKTGTGMILGTIGYLSPEQAVGKPADFRSDQFAMGALLYELATGERPFRRETVPESLTAVIREEPEPLRARNAELPAQLGWIVERCLAKDPNDRYGSTRDLARDLADLRDRLSEVSRVPAEASSAPNLRARRAGLLGAVGVLGLVCGVGLALWLRPAPPSVMVQSRFLSHSGADSSPAVSPDLGTIAFTSSRDGRRRIWLKQLATGAEAPLTEGSDDFPRFSPDGSQILFVRGFGGDEALFRVPTLGGEPRRILADVRFADWSPDGKSIAFLSSRVEGDTSLSILGRVAPDGSEPEEIVRFPGRLLLHPRWSPDGREVALVERANQSGSASTLEIVDLETRRSRTVWPAIGLLSAPAWTPDGKGLIVSRAASVTAAVTSSDGWIYRVEQSSGEPTRLAWVATSGRSLDLAGPGRVVIDTESPRQNLLAIEREERGPRVESWLTHGNSSDRQPIFSPDGEWVLFSSDRDGNLDLWKVSTLSGAVRRVTDDTASDWDPAFTPQGQILWSSNRSGTYEVWRAESDGSAARQLTRIGHAENPIASPDGNWLVFVSVAPGKEGLWRARADGSEPTRLVTQYALVPEISPDGAVVSYIGDFGSERHSIRAVSLASGAPAELSHRPRVSVSLGQGLTIGRHRWLPDGRGLIYLGLDDRDRSGLYELVFDRPSAAATLSPYFGFELDRATESFALSPDGKRLVVAQWEQQRSLLLVEGIPSIEPGE